MVYRKILNKNPDISDKIFTILKTIMNNFIKIYSLFVKHQDNEKFENINTKTLIDNG